MGRCDSWTPLQAKIPKKKKKKDRHVLDLVSLDKKTVFVFPLSETDQEARQASQNIRFLSISLTTALESTVRFSR